MDLIVIACCKTKTAEGKQAYHSSPLAESLSPSSFRQLMDARKELANILNLESGPDLGFNLESDRISYLPAYKRYAGIIYKRSDFRTKYPRLNGNRILIISALYGILDADEYIRNYELNMNHTLPIGRKVKTWWKKNHLGTYLSEIILNNRYSRIHDLLSNAYREALSPWPPNSFAELITQYDYPGAGSGSVWRRAEQLEILMSK